MKKLLIIFLIVIPLSVLSKNKQDEIIIPKEAIRFRVLANSNNSYDQKVKMKLSIELQKEIQELLKETKNIKEAKQIINNNMELLNMKIKEILRKENYKDDYKLSFGNTFFPEKKYKDIIYEKGYYDTLLITLGKGEGHNWWCVLFPPLCLMEAEETNTGKTEYKFFIKEILDKYL